MNWKSVLVVLVALGVGLGVVFRLATRLPVGPDHQVFINGEVITMDSENRVVEALAVRGDRIEAAGSTDDIMALVEEGTVVHDLRGRTLLPGFIDAHGHFPGTGVVAVAADLTSPPVGRMLSIEDVVAALQAEAERRPDSDWIHGSGYDDTLLLEKRHLNRDDLDRVSTERPVLAMHVSGHIVAVNSRGLELLGIDASTPDPAGGVIQRRPGSDEPNGVLEETARMAAMNQAMDMGMADFFALTKTALLDYLSHGVTTAQSGGMTRELLQGLTMASKLGMIPLRLNMFAFEEDLGPELLSGEVDPADYQTERASLVAVKLVADGSIQGYTGYLSQPYYTPYQGDESYRGYPSIDRETLFSKVQAYHEAGFQLAIHGNGDASIEDILDAFEAAQRQHPVDDPRMILIHAQMAREDQVARMKGLGVTPSFFTAHTWFWGDRHRDIFLGPERAAVISPSRWALDHGVRYSSHLDSPVVPMRPLQAVWSQVFRQTYAGDVLGPEQRVDVMQALRAVTIDAAWQTFQENDRGSLEPGKYADIVILSGSPLAEPGAMRELQVDRTIIGGAEVYRRH